MPKGVYQHRSRPLEERFWSKVDKRGPDECWEWRGSFFSTGYGQISIGHAGRRSTHRVAWELTFGGIPAKLHICHRCDNPRCVNPAHLFAGTALDNMRDKVAKGRHPNQLKTHCPNGHEYTPENTYIHGRVRRSRWCRICVRARQKLASATRRAA